MSSVLSIDYKSLVSINTVSPNNVQTEEIINCTLTFIQTVYDHLYVNHDGP